METMHKTRARLKRQASELAAQIHDNVEERLWQDYQRLPELCQQLIATIEAANAVPSD